jgi:hypothetical protein
MERKLKVSMKDGKEEGRKMKQTKEEGIEERMLEKREIEI